MTTHKVYMYTFPNGKIYIGVTKHSIEERRDNGYQHNKQLQVAMREAGWKNIKVDILAQCEDQDTAFNKEQEFIAKFNATDPDVGYNKSHGGKSTFQGLHHTEKHRQKMSKLFKGRQFSEETIEKMRRGHAKERRPVSQIDSEGKVVSRFESLLCAARAVDGYQTNIARACKSGRKYKGFAWKYANRKGVV